VRHTPGVWFSAAFRCPRDQHLIEIETFQAVIDGPGLEIGCIVCRTMFLVTNEGATPITDFDLTQLNTKDSDEEANGTAEQVADIDQHVSREGEG